MDDEKKKGWFAVPNSFIERSGDLTLREIRVWLAHLRYGNNREHSSASAGTIARLLGYKSPRDAQRGNESLTKKGWLEVVEQSAGGSARSTTKRIPTIPSLRANSPPVDTYGLTARTTYGQTARSTGGLTARTTYGQIARTNNKEIKKENQQPQQQPRERGDDVGGVLSREGVGQQCDTPTVADWLDVLALDSIEDAPGYKALAELKISRRKARALIEAEPRLLVAPGFIQSLTPTNANNPAGVVISRLGDLDPSDDRQLEQETRRPLLAHRKRQALDRGAAMIRAAGDGAGLAEFDAAIVAAAVDSMARHETPSEADTDSSLTEARRQFFRAVATLPATAFDFDTEAGAVTHAMARWLGIGDWSFTYVELARHAGYDAIAGEYVADDRRGNQLEGRKQAEAAALKTCSATDRNQLADEIGDAAVYELADGAYTLAGDKRAGPIAACLSDEHRRALAFTAWKAGARPKSAAAATPTTKPEAAPDPDRQRLASVFRESANKEARPAVAIPDALMRAIVKGRNITLAGMNDAGEMSGERFEDVRQFFTDERRDLERILRAQPLAALDADGDAELLSYWIWVGGREAEWDSIVAAAKDREQNRRAN